MAPASNHSIAVPIRKLESTARLSAEERRAIEDSPGSRSGP